MNVTQEQIFEKKLQLQKDIELYEKQLQKMIAQQGQMTNITQLAESILAYNEIERQIEDRAHLFSLLSSPPESLLSPYVKSELFSYIVSAETVSTEMVNFLMNDVLTQLRLLIESGEDDSIDLIQAEFREYLLPGKIIGERFEELDSLCNEMNRYCTALDSSYNPAQAERVLRYAFEISLNSDIQLDSVIEALKNMSFTYLSEADRAFLLDAVEERLASIRFEATKKHNIAMERAVKLLEHRETEEALDTVPFVDDEK